MHYYFRTINYIDGPGIIKDFLDNEENKEKHENTDNHYNKLIQQYPVYRWKTEVVSNSDYYDYLRELDEAIKQLCGLEQWNVVNIQSFQERKIKTESGERQVDVSGDYIYYTKYTSVLVLRRRMIYKEFCLYIQNAEESFHSGKNNISWDEDLDDPNVDASGTGIRL
ncbi:hypothetical protein AB3N59_19815 [Leptospira sp. WS92.C1]